MVKKRTVSKPNVYFVSIFLPNLCSFSLHKGSLLLQRFIKYDYIVSYVIEGVSKVPTGPKHLNKNLCLPQTYHKKLFFKEKKISVRGHIVARIL